MDDRFSGRRGTYRVIYRIDDQARVETVVDVAHRRDVYRAEAVACDRLRRTETQRPLARGRRLSTKTEETSHLGVASVHCSHVKGPFRSWKGPFV
jgi:hypothetical protein